jgi:hypothetical protein
VVIGVDYLLAKEFQAAALAKGYAQKKYFWLCFLLGMMGYILVVALPDRGNTHKAMEETLPDL